MIGRLLKAPIDQIMGRGTRRESSGGSNYFGTYFTAMESRKTGQALRVILLAYIIVNAYTFNVSVPGVGLDGSWAFALNHLINSNLLFGKDVFFTYGPLGFVLGPMDIGRNVLIAGFFHLGVWLLFASILVYGSYRRLFSLDQLLLFAISTIFYSWTLEYLLPALVLILILFQSSVKTWLPVFLLAVLLTVSLFFIKFNLAMFAWSALLAFSFLQAIINRYKGLTQLAMSAILVPVLFAVSYFVYNPSLADLLGYVKAAYTMSSEYSVSMSLPGRWYEIYLALLFVAAYLDISFHLYKSKLPTFWHSIAFLPSLFFPFKHGFIRQDGHVLAFFISVILVIGLLLLFSDLKRAKMKEMNYIYPLLVFFCFFIFQQRFHSVLVNNILPVSSIKRISNSLKFRTIDKDRFLRKGVLPETIMTKIDGAKVGIFPYEISYAAANKLDYSPLPVFQAFCAYASSLDNLNADFLSGGKAPPYLLTGFGSIDGRHCLLDGPSTWLSIYKWYEPCLSTESVLLLRKREAARFERLEPAGQAEYNTTESIRLPESAEPLLVKISMGLTPTGLLAKTFYKVLPVAMALTDDAGRVCVFRVTPDTLKNGIFLNNLPLDLHELDLLLNGTAVRKFCSFELLGEGLEMYRDKMSVQFIRIPGIEISHPFEDLSFPEGIEKSPKKTTFAIESIEPRIAKKKAQKIVVRNERLITIRGWAVDEEAEDAGAGVWADIDGKSYPALRCQRHDVAVHFDKQGYENAGFTIGIHVSQFSPGLHELSLKLLAKNKTYYYQTDPMVLEIPAN